MAHWTPLWLNLRSRWKTVLAAGLAGLFAFTTAHADPLGDVWSDPAPYSNPFQQPEQEDLDDWSQRYLERQYKSFGGESEYQRAENDRWRARESCNAITNNARARELCLQGLW